MDTKGREELLGMQSCQSYQGCPVCLHTWTPGKVVGRRQVICDGYRCFLHPDSAARQKTFEYEGEKYEYRSVRVRVRVRVFPHSWYIYLLVLQERRKAASSCEARRYIRTKGGWYRYEQETLLRAQDDTTSCEVAGLQLVPDERAGNNAR